MSLVSDVERYKELSGDDGWNTTVGEMKQYLDGYDNGCAATVYKVIQIVHTYGYNNAPLFKNQVDALIKEIDSLLNEGE